MKETYPHNEAPNPLTGPQDGNFAKKAELSKNQLEDKLNAGLAHRPEAEKLVQEGIVTKEETAEPIQQLQDTDHTK
ncbi:hypothetical protein PGTUg99_026895 [Puccinia graminis f. sp. tritici]|uniref:Uncharacterized protein n=1 Tax=Puccinia graminis f. sp. tritici TaxID=56615 RepID=A0A5B0S8H2_PUCGR|nr:hypothetical protein PGTUg99_026895 [Puccinia graminis f. sp. tritici]